MGERAGKRNNATMDFAPRTPGRVHYFTLMADYFTSGDVGGLEVVAGCPMRLFWRRRFVCRERNREGATTAA
jgi:hypothetical protein